MDSETSPFFSLRGIYLVIYYVNCVVVSFRTHGAFPKVRSLPQYLDSRIDVTARFAMAFACAKSGGPHAVGTARGLQGRVLV